MSTEPDAAEVDELVSAYLDGELGAAEMARVDADPKLSARAMELRDASRALAAPVVPASDLVRDAAIARALDEGPPTRSPEAHPAVDAPVGGLAILHGPRRWPRLSVAAAAALLLVAAPLAARFLRGGDHDLSAAARPPTLRTKSTNAEPSRDLSSRGRARHVGTVDNADELVRRVSALLGAVDKAGSGQEASALATDDAERTLADQSGSRCEERIRQAQPSLGRTLWAGGATYHERSAQVFVFASAPEAGQTVVVVTADAACRTLLQREL